MAGGLLSILVACGSSPPASPSPTGSGFVEVELELEPRPAEFFASQQRGRIVAADGAILADWEITSAAGAVSVPAGSHQLEAFTVYFSDFLSCAPDPATGRDVCTQPTLAPVQVCSMPIEVPAGATVSARFRALREGRCELAGLALPT